MIGDGSASDHRGLLVHYRLLPTAVAARQAVWQQTLQTKQRQRLQTCYRPKSRSTPALQAVWRQPGAG